MVSELDFISIKLTLPRTAKVRNGECGSTGHTKAPEAYLIGHHLLLGLSIVRSPPKTNTNRSLVENTERSHHHQFGLELGLARQFLNKGLLWWEVSDRVLVPSL